MIDLVVLNEGLVLLGLQEASNNKLCFMVRCSIIKSINKTS
jgi:hypothetical protein